MNSNKHINLCIIEDDEALRASLKELVRSSDNIACAADFNNAEDFISFLKIHTNIDIILLDIGLPGISGLEAIEQIKEISPETKILILTIFDDDESVYKAFTMGASGFVLKSASRENLLTDIVRVSEGALIYSINIAQKVLKSTRKESGSAEFEKLSKREKEVLTLVTKGFKNTKISDALFISEDTVKSHLKNIYRKIQVNSKVEALAKTVEEGWGG